MSSSLTAGEIVRLLDLAPLEGEGGFFRQTWLRPGADTDAPEATAILYLVTPESFSTLHRLDHDEMFHFHIGDPCLALSVAPDGEVTEATLGHDVAVGMRVQHLVPAGTWQATRLVEGGSWALLGTTMSPGFRWSGFELATRDTLRDLGVEGDARLQSLLAQDPDQD